MTALELLSRLDGVRPRGLGKWSARCPAHEDKFPSLSVAEGSGRILVHCFAGCDNHDIVAAIGMTMADLFFNAPDSRTIQGNRVCRIQKRQRQAQREEVDGFTIDALREADYFVRSRQGLDISAWTYERLNDELDVLADARELLWAEELAQWT